MIWLCLLITQFSVDDLRAINIKLIHLMYTFFCLMQNEDVIILYLSILQKVGGLFSFYWSLFLHPHFIDFNFTCEIILYQYENIISCDTRCFVVGQSSETLRHHGLDVFQQLLRDSLSNRASCVRAGMLNLLLDWFSKEDNDGAILKIAQLIQVIGGHSISGKDIRKIFALLRSEKVGARQQYSSLLLSTVLSMLNEKGPTAFFDLNGNNSVSPYPILVISAITSCLTL